MMRFIQGVTSLSLVAAITVVVIFTDLSIADLFASILAFIATGWAIICVSVLFFSILSNLLSSLISFVPS